MSRSPRSSDIAADATSDPNSHRRADLQTPTRSRNLLEKLGICLLVVLDLALIGFYLIGVISWLM
jgi:hypothetical protein